MADGPFEPFVDARLRDFLAGELRQAEIDFRGIARHERRAARRSPSTGVLFAAVVILALVVAGSLFAGRVFFATGGTPLGADGLPTSIDGEPVARGDEIGSRAPGSSFLAGGTLVLDTVPCLSRSPRAQLGCAEGWELVAGPPGDPSAVFALDGIVDAPGFVRTSGALTVARVRAWTTPSGELSGEILAVEAIAWRQPTKGPMPPEASPPEGGEVNEALVPDFVSTWGRDGVTIAGYVPKRYLLQEGDLVPGSPSDPPQPEPMPVYGEDLATLVGHMVPGVGFVALGGAEPSPGATVSGTPASPVPPASAGPSGSPRPPGMDCGRIPADPCLQAIALARAVYEDEVATAATRIVVDDTCPLDSVCDRMYPFDAIVVFADDGGDTTGWWAYRVYGTDQDTPTTVDRWIEQIPAHLVQRIREMQPRP